MKENKTGKAVYNDLCKKLKKMDETLKKGVSRAALLKLDQEFDALELNNPEMATYLHKHKSHYEEITHLSTVVVNAIGLEKLKKPIAERENQLEKFQILFKALQDKRDNLHQRYPTDKSDDRTKAYGAACHVVKRLGDYSEAYLYGRINLQQFKDDTIKFINHERKGILGQHRGCKELLANIALFISTLGIGYALAAFFTQSLTPIRLNTDSIDRLENILDNVGALS